MMALQRTQTQAITSLLTTQLNSLANGGISAASAAVDGSGDKVGFNFTLVLGAAGGARAGFVNLYCDEAVDGTNYGDNLRFIGAFDVSQDTAAGEFTLTGVEGLFNGNMRFYIENDTGQAFNATGNTLEYSAYTYEDV